VLIIVFPGMFVLGVLSTLAIAGFRGYLSAAKSAEARASVGAIGRLAVASTEASPAHRPCPSASRFVPTKAPTGTKYVSSPSDWNIDGPSAGFGCLKFSIDAPQYYSYGYESTPTSFRAIAHGDLNGDGVESTFIAQGAVANGSAVLSPAVLEEHPKE